VRSATHQIWAYIFAILFPSLVFITAFSLLIYFFAKVLVEESGSQKQNKIMAVGCNFILYLSFIGIGVYCK